MKLQLLLLLLLVTFGLNAQNIKPLNVDGTKIITLEMRLKILEEKTGTLQQNIDKLEKASAESIAIKQKECDENFISYKEETKNLINLYIFFITGGILLIGFAINFIGKSAIKKRVEELITETAQKHIESKIVETLNSKITNELIANEIKKKSEDEINSIIKSIETKGDKAIDHIKSKGDEAIKTMLASPPKVRVKLNKKNSSDLDITQQNNAVRSEEFFNLAFNSKDPRIQIELYKNVLEIEPNNFYALNNMAFAHNNLNETKQAIELLDKALKINPKYSTAYANRAQSYNLQNNYVLALADIEKANALNPTSEYAYAIKGNIFTKQGKFPEAEVALSKSIEMNPNSADAHFNLAFFYEESKDFPKSLENYEKAASLGFANKAMLYNNMAVLYRRLKEYPKAIEYIDMARQFNPDFPNIDGTLGLIYADQNDDENFYKYIKIALEKGCPVWNYLSDPGFDKYRESKRLLMLIEPYKKKFYS